MMRRLIVALMATLALVLVGCASQNTPYDAPSVGRDGVAAVIGMDRFEFDNGDRYVADEVLVYRVVLDDGRACDFVYMKVNRGDRPDQWFALHRQRLPALGIMGTIMHVTLPQDICLRVVLPDGDDGD